MLLMRNLHFVLRLVLVVFAGIMPSFVFALGCPTAQEVRDRLRVEYFDGMFVVGTASPNGGVMLRLAAFAAAPHMTEETRIGSPRPYAVQLAQDILGRGSKWERAYIEAGLYNVTTGSMKTPGGKAVVRQFVEACGPTMIELAPKPPFFMALAHQQPLVYDEARGGLPLREPPNYLRMNSGYMDFLTPKATHEFIRSSEFRHMTRKEADLLFAKLDADASSHGTARQAQSVAIVEVLTIEPELRVAEVRLADYGLYTYDFSQRLFDTARVEESASKSAAPAAGTQPLRDGLFATAAEARAKALALCQAHRATDASMDCGCIADEAAAGWQADSNLHIYTHLNEAVTNTSRKCADPVGAQAAALEFCETTFGEGHPFSEKLGVETYCRCYTDRVAAYGPVKASVSCNLLDEYRP
jgi:hypothetical protein